MRKAEFIGSMLWRLWVFVLFSLSCAAAHAGARADEMLEPLPRRLDRESWTLDLSVSYLTRITSPNATFSYRLAPVLLTLKSPGFASWTLGNGTLTIRNSAALSAEAIFGGPETHYFGLTLRPAFEWWQAGERFYAYFSPGGGVGVLDSRGIDGGQGQDFTFNIVAGGGLGWKIGERASLRAGVLFQHLSNGGQTDPNPGLNALGPEIGVSISF